MKYIKIAFVFLMILTLFLPVISIATEPSDTSNNSNNLPEASSIDLISLSNEEIGLNTDFYLILNLANINYNKFKVEITNNANIPANDVTSTVSDLESTLNITSFTIDKNLITLDKIGIVYTSPAQETNISFSVTITDLEYTKESLTEELSSLQKDIKDLENKLSSLDMNSETYEDDYKKLEEDISEKVKETEDLANEITNFKPNTLEDESSITIRKDVVNENKLTDETEKDKEQTKPWNDMDSLVEEMYKDKNKEMTMSMKQMMLDLSKLETNLKSANDTITSLTKNVTYQGSQNNYLKSLSISGVQFKNNFNKTALNYFATVDENTSKVTVNAVAEDSSAIITIYGNTNLKSGKNKVLINVTADDGSIRTYKIYITK